MEKGINGIPGPKIDQFSIMNGHLLHKITVKYEHITKQELKDLIDQLQSIYNELPE